MPDLFSGLTHDLGTGLAQAAAAIVLCCAVVFLCHEFGVEARREAAVSMARGLLQMVLVGLLLAAMVHGPALLGLFVLVLMIVAAAFTVSGRLVRISGAFELSLLAIATGGGTTIAVMLAIRILKADIVILIPVGSMIIANAMNACAQAAERFRADVIAHLGQIETALALGASPGGTVAPYVHSAVYASMLPRLDMLKSLGFVWIPGVMAGMMVTGANPIYAGIFQFIIVSMILAASGITGLVTILLIRSRSFSPAAQLLLRN